MAIKEYSNDNPMTMASEPTVAYVSNVSIPLKTRHKGSMTVEEYFGNVNICIYNASGNLIYNNVVDSSMQQYVVIPITSVVNGTYTVVLSNANGYAEGDFERN